MKFWDTSAVVPQRSQRTRNVVGTEQKDKNPTAQRIIKVMEKLSHVTQGDIESLLRMKKEAKQPTRSESPLDL